MCKNKRNFFLLSTIPSALCVVLSLSYDNSNTDSALGVLYIGMLITCVISPLLLAVLCCYFTIKKSLSFSSCIAMCVFMNALANISYILSLCIISLVMMSKVTGMLLYTLPSFAISMAILAVCLFIVKLIKRKHDKSKGTGPSA